MGNILIENGKAVGNIGKLPESVSVTADGVKTSSTLLNELFALIDHDKITENSKLIYYVSATVSTVHNISTINPTAYEFTRVNVSTNPDIAFATLTVKETGSTYQGATGAAGGITFNNQSTGVPPSGRKFIICY